MMRPFVLALAMIVLVSGLLFPPLSAYTSVYPTMVAMLLGGVLLVPRYWDILIQPAFAALWLAAASFLISIIALGGSLENFLIYLALLPVFIAPGATFLVNEERQLASAQVIALLCLIGSLAALAIAAHDVLINNLVRAGGGNNPIHFGGISLIIGFMSLIGLFGTRSVWRYLFFLGPLFGFGAALLSDSRGPVLAGLVMAIVSVTVILISLRRDKFVWALFGAGAMVLIFASLYSGAILLGRLSGILSDLQAFRTDGGAVDHSIQLRFEMLQAALDAFKSKPAFGFGLSRFGEVLSQVTNVGNSVLDTGHFHNDLADFAVAGGAFGILAYLSLLVAPLLVFRTAQDKEIRRGVLLGGLLLSLGYFTLGLTNPMFGILPQTALYGVLLGLLMAIALGARPQQITP